MIYFSLVIKIRKYTRVGIALSAIVALIAPVFLAGCLGDDKTEIEIKGSTTVLPIAEAAAEAYMDDNDDVEITVSGGGSSKGVEAVSQGTVDIGMASRELKSSEDTGELIKHVVAKDGIAIIVNTANTVTALTMDQVKAIYNGSITDWSTLGGSGAIVVVGRDSASGTRATFEELVMDDQEPTTAMEEKSSNGLVHSMIKETPGAIGYVGLGYVDSDVQGVDIDGVTPSVATVQDGTYPISRDLNMFTKGQPSGAVKEFIEYIQSSEGQSIVEAEGFVPLS